MAKDSERSETPARVSTRTAASAETGAQGIKWDTSQVKSSYSNVCNVTSTREEVVLNFGINSDWDQRKDKMEVQLQHRIILSPFAAKRLSELIVNLIREHESRYGELK